jgi:Multiple antibiotic transporter
MLLMKSDPSRGLEWVGAILIAMAVSMAAFFASSKLKEWLGPRALSAIERLMGLVLTAIAIEMLLGGLSQYLGSH